MPHLCFPLIFPPGKKPVAQPATALPEQQHHSNLQLGARVQHDVLQSVLDVFRPRGQPGNRVVKAHLLPLVPFWRLGDLGVPAGRAGLQPSDHEGEETGRHLNCFFTVSQGWSTHCSITYRKHTACPKLLHNMIRSLSFECWGQQENLLGWWGVF